MVERLTSAGRAKARQEWNDIWHQKLAEDPAYTLTLRIAASYLDVTPRALVKLIETGAIQGAKTGRGKTWRVSLASLKAYREEHA
jgi:excisionase family DNA binding protein